MLPEHLSSQQVDAVAWGGCRKIELLLINKKNKKISNIFLVTKSLCNADTWQRARFMAFRVEERFLIADGSLI